MIFFFFILSQPVTDWLSEQNGHQPQIPFVFARGLENILLAPAKAAQNHTTISAIEDGHLGAIKLTPYEDCSGALNAFKDDILHFVRGRSQCTDVPAYTPIEFTPDNNRVQKRKKEESTPRYIPVPQQTGEHNDHDSFGHSGRGSFGRGGGRFSGRFSNWERWLWPRPWKWRQARKDA